MAKKIRPGDSVKGYQIIEMLNQGALALSYAATSPKGEKVFFKQYKSPSNTVPWYRGYVEYQRQLKDRIESSSAHRFTYRFIEFFEANWGHPCYFQVFEFVEQGHDLEEILDKIRENPSSVSWEQRLTFAKVIMASINALHEARIVHCDLKPANIQLFKDDTISAGFVVKLIDVDYSILTDQRAPWHGHQGYVGSPGYFSPEHLEPGGIPSCESDVFTCGLILYELLGADGHPYRHDEPAEYHKAALRHAARPPALIGSVPSPGNDGDVIEAIHRCLAPSPAHRPTAKELLLVLNGRLKLDPAPSGTPAPSEGGRAPAPARESAPASVPPAPSAPTAAPSGTTSQELALVAESGRDVRMRVRTPVGGYLLKQLGDDAVYFHKEQQFVIEKRPDGQWHVVHNPSAKHQTLLNGASVRDQCGLKDGDVLAVGSEEKGIQKLPLNVRLL